jgi:hypothetical protein
MFLTAVNVRRPMRLESGPANLLQTLFTHSVLFSQSNRLTDFHKASRQSPGRSRCTTIRATAHPGWLPRVEAAPTSCTTVRLGTMSDRRHTTPPPPHPGHRLRRTPGRYPGTESSRSFSRVRFILFLHFINSPCDAASNRMLRPASKPNP